MPRNRRLHRSAAITAVVGSLVYGATLASADPGLTVRVSVSTEGAQGDNISGRFAGPAINGDGQVVAFDSIATTLVPDDTNEVADIFVHDRATDTTDRVSVNNRGREGNGHSSRPAMDAAGSLVVFDSSATNLVRFDTNSSLDVFVHDRTTGTTERVSVSDNEEQADQGGHSPSISADGRFVTFISTSSNLVADTANTAEDVYVRDLVAGTTERVSVNSAGQEGNSSSTLASISPDGRWVGFSSFASNLIPNDTNDRFDVFLHDRVTGTTELVSANRQGQPGNDDSSRPSVSEDGLFIAFMSDASNLVRRDTNGRTDVFVRNRLAGRTELASVSSDEEQADGASQHPAVRGFTASGPDITPDGRFVAFYAAATNLVPGDTNTCEFVFDDPGTCPDVFVRDRLLGTTTRWSEASDGTQADDRSADPVISADGGTVAFFSIATNLVPGDTNTCPPIFFDPGQCPDIFVHEQ